MSFKRDGDDKCALDNQRKRRVTELLYEDIEDNEVSRLCNGRFVCKLCVHKPTFDTLNMFYVHRQGKKHQNSMVYAAEQRHELADLIDKRKHEQCMKAGLIATQQDVVYKDNPVCTAKKRKRKPHDRKPVLDYDISSSSKAVAHCSVETTSGALLPGHRFSSCLSKTSKRSTLGESCGDVDNADRHTHAAGIEQLSQSCDKIDNKHNISVKYRNQSIYKQTIPAISQSQSGYKQTIPATSQNQSGYKQTIPATSPNQSGYKQTIPATSRSQSDYKLTIPDKSQNQSDNKQYIPSKSQNQSNYKHNFQGNQSTSKIRNDNSVIRSSDVTKLVERTNAEQRNKFYLSRKKQREELTSTSSYRPLDTDANADQSTVAPTQVWEYYKGYKGKVPFKMKMMDKSNKLAAGTKALKAEQACENIETQVDRKVESTLCAGKRERAEQFLNAFGSGWKRDWTGCWVKDEDAEFDSDEEPPDIP